MQQNYMHVYLEVNPTMFNWNYPLVSKHRIGVLVMIPFLKMQLTIYFKTVNNNANELSICSPCYLHIFIFSCNIQHICLGVPPNKSKPGKLLHQWAANVCML